MEMDAQMPIQITGTLKALVWSDWRSQMEHRICTAEELKKWIDLTTEEESAIDKCAGRYRWTITPYYASLMSRTDPNCPVRRQAVPSLLEFEHFPEADVDPVGDRAYRKTNRVVHKYRDRVMLLVTQACPVYCRHCTRKFHTTDLEGTYFGEKEAHSFAEDFAYIESHPEIRDVLLSGGDPLVYSDERLDYILHNIRRIPHVEIIRIGTRFPVLLPQRITADLCDMLERYHPLWLNTHFNHAKEITADSAAACDRLIRHGIVVQNQSVLLKGVNDDLATLRDLLVGLLKIRVRPYYLYHCDNVTGVSHFATTIEGRSLMRALFGRVTGFAVPQYVLTTYQGKIPLAPNYVREIRDGICVLESYEGEEVIRGYC